MFRKSIIGACLVFLAAILGGCDITTVVNTKPTATPVAPLGPPAAWSAQYALARQEANKVDKSAFLWKVTSDESINDNPPRSFDYSKPLHVDFTFVTPNGYFDVLIADSDPPVVLGVDLTQLQVNAANPTSATTLASDFGPGEQSIAVVKIGPRDAYSKTLAESQQFDYTPTILLEGADPKKGTRAIWTVAFIEEGGDLLFRIDPQTGNIIGRDHVIANTPTPTQP